MSSRNGEEVKGMWLEIGVFVALLSLFELFTLRYGVDSSDGDDWLKHRRV